MFYVIGGEWASTDFDKLNTDTLEACGPYDDPRSALDAWRGRAQRNVDNCNHRVFIATPQFNPETMEPSFKIGDHVEIKAEAVEKIISNR